MRFTPELHYYTAIGLARYAHLDRKDHSSFMKFIHTSDWHLGRQFHNVSLIDDQRFVLQQLIQWVRDEQPDAVIIAGDIFDRSVAPATAIELLDEVLSELCHELNTAVIMIAGNHDSAERLRFGATHLRKAGLHILTRLEDITTPVQIETDNGTLSFYGIPYCDPEMVADTFGVDSASFDMAHTFLVNQVVATLNPQHVNVLISHCFIDGAEESESERPLSIGGSDRVSYQPCLPFNYVALGHLHAPQYKGVEYIRYSGSLLKYSFSEVKQRKGVTIVEFDKDQVFSYRNAAFSPLRDMRIIEGAFDDICRQGRSDPKPDDYILVRLTDNHAILDSMARLREVYPNTLQIEKPNLYRDSPQPIDINKVKRDELALFADFFKQIKGQEMNQDQAQAMHSLIKQLRQGEN